MRWMVVLAVVLALVPGAALADGQYQTANGPESLADMATQLGNVGYDGPWDDASVIDAYARTTGGDVTLVAAPAPARAPLQVATTTVLSIGGLGSTPFGTADMFSLLWANMAGVPHQQFDYDSCQSTAISESQLVARIRALQQSGVSKTVIVAHSLGGVIAFDVLADNPDLAQTVRGVVTVDSPLLGIDAISRVALEAYEPAGCSAIADLCARNTVTSKAWVVTSAFSMLKRGVALDVISNPDDLLGFAQGIDGPAVNFVIDAVDSGANHSAVFKVPAAAKQLAQLVSGLL